MTQVLRLSSGEEARELARRLPYLRPETQVVVDVPTMPSSRKRVEEARLAKLYNACGCTAGSVGLGIGLTAWAWVWVWILIRTFPHDFIVMIPIGVLTTVAATLVGKFVGLAYSRRALRARLLEFAGEVDARSSLLGATVDEELSALVRRGDGNANG